MGGVTLACTLVPSLCYRTRFYVGYLGTIVCVLFVKCSILVWDELFLNFLSYGGYT